MRARADYVEKAASNLAVVGTLAMVEEMGVVTPADKSEAVSNWQVNIGAPVGSAIAPYVPGKLGSTKGASAAEMVQAAQIELAAKQPGQPIYMSNLVRHIKFLDEGSSAQFAGGFVPRAVIVFRFAVEQAAQNFWKGFRA